MYLRGEEAGEELLCKRLFILVNFCKRNMMMKLSKPSVETYVTSSFKWRNS